MKKHQFIIKKWLTATNANFPYAPRWKVQLYCIFLVMFVATTAFCPPVFASSDPCNGKHNYIEYYNDCIGDWCETDYCQDCGHIRIHTCLYPLRFMTISTTYSYAGPSATSTPILLTTSARQSVNVTGRVRGQDGELWLLLDNGNYISADSVAFNFDYYAEDAAKNVTSSIIQIIGMFKTFNPWNKTYDMKNDELLGITYRYKLYSSGIVLSDSYSGEQIGNMMYGYVSAAKGYSYCQALHNANNATEKEDSPEDKYSILLGYNYRKNGVWLEEVSDQYVGKTVAIKSIEANKYVSSNTDQNIKGINAAANRDSAGAWELFIVEKGETGTIGFRSLGNDQ